MHLLFITNLAKNNQVYIPKTSFNDQFQPSIPTLQKPRKIWFFLVFEILNFPFVSLVYILLPRIYIYLFIILL